MSQNPISIRLLDVNDVAAMLPLAHEFYNQGDLPGSVKDDVFVKTWRAFISQGVGYVVAAFDGNELVGCIGGVIVPDSNDGEIFANEMFWFVSQKHRGSRLSLKLFDEYERVAKQYGAVRISMVHLANDTSEKLSNLYQRRGYRPVEVHYVKEVK